MSQKRPDSPIRAEITDINREFLHLLTHPHLNGAADHLGLDQGTLECLRGLSSEELDAIAAAPVLLMEFSPSQAGAADPRQLEQKVADEAYGTVWQRELTGYANRLLTFIWQTARRDQGIGSLHLGLEPNQAQQLAQLSFARISRNGATAASYLRARLCWHPSFWSDLIRAVRSGNPEQQLASLLAVIQLSVACPRPIARRSIEQGYC